MKKFLAIGLFLYVAFSVQAQNSCDSLPRIEQASVTTCLGTPVTLNVTNGFQDSILAGFNYIGTFGGNQYYASNTVEYWEDAKVICEAAGGHLATASSAAENTFIASWNNSTFYWIGYFQNLSSTSYSEPAGGWEWVTGEPTTFTGWAPGEPNQNVGEPEDYVYTNFGGIPEWNDAPSIDPTYFVVLRYVLEIENPYAILWSTGDTTDTITVNPSVTTTYYMTSSDTARSCYDSVTVYVNDPDPMLPDTISTCSPSIDLAAASGYTSYLWSTSETDSVITVTGSGMYGVGIADSIGCVGVDSVRVSVVSANINQVDTAFCIGSSVSLIADSASGNTFIWSTAETSAGISVSPTVSTVYTIQVSDGISTCTDSVSIMVSDLQASVVSQNISCAGSVDGSATVTATNGIGTYTYLWNTSDSVPGLTALSPGTYTVSVTDSLGCNVVDSAVITEPNLLFLNTVDGDVLCFGDSNGTIDLTVSGGTLPYMYSWSTGDTIEDLANLAPGTYSVLVTDTIGCLDSITALISEPPVLSTSATVQDLLCNGDGTGAIDVIVSGGTMPYVYAWATSETTEDLSGLGGGVYSLLVTDTNGCMDSVSATVLEPTALVTTYTQTDNACNGDFTGSIDLTVTGGTIPYQYSWADGDTLEDRTALAGGTYPVNVSDGNGCLDSLTVTILEPAVLGLTASITDAPCGGATGNNGAIDLTVTGGTTPYTYAWQSGPTTEDLSNLSGGSYTVLVTDTNGCTDSLVAVVAQPSALLLSSVATDATCYGHVDGTIDLTVAGGTTPYTYSWSNSDTTEDINDLPAGVYTVTVTDVNICSSTLIDTVNEPAQIITSVISGADSTVEFFTENYSVVQSSGSTYQWFVTNGTLLSGNGTNQISVLWGGASSGQVAVYEIDSTGCIGDSVYFNVYLELAPGYTENTLLEPITVYPNPVQKMITIEFGQTIAKGKVIIISGDGRMVHIQPIFKKSRITADMSLYADGLYFVEIIDDGEGAKSIMPVMLQK